MMPNTEHNNAKVTFSKGSLNQYKWNIQDTNVELKADFTAVIEDTVTIKNSSISFGEQRISANDLNIGNAKTTISTSSTYERKDSDKELVDVFDSISISDGGCYRLKSQAYNINSIELSNGSSLVILVGTKVTVNPSSIMFVRDNSSIIFEATNENSKVLKITDGMTWMGLGEEALCTFENNFDDSSLTCTGMTDLQDNDIA